jgi:hypothetical protein
MLFAILNTFPHCKFFFDFAVCSLKRIRVRRVFEFVRQPFHGNHPIESRAERSLLPGPWTERPLWVHT